MEEGGAGGPEILFKDCVWLPEGRIRNIRCLQSPYKFYNVTNLLTRLSILFHLSLVISIALPFPKILYIMLSVMGLHIHFPH